MNYHEGHSWRFSNQLIARAISFKLVIFLTFVASIQVEASSAIDSLKQEIKVAPDTQKIQLIDELVWEYSTSNADSAIFWGKRAVAIADDLKDFKYKAKANNVLGLAYYQKGRFNEAIRHYVKALEFNKKAEAQEQLAANYNNLGLAYFQIGDYKDALDYQLKSLQIKESLNDSLKLAHAYNNIGLIYNALGDYKDALNNYQKSLKLYKFFDDHYSIGGTYSNMGIIYHKKGDYQKAKEYYRKSLKVNDSIGRLTLQANVYNNLGITYSEEGAFYKGQEYFEKALAIGKEVNKSKAVLESYFNLGENHYKRKNLDSAIFFLKKAEEIALDIAMKPKLVDIYQMTAKCYEKLDSSQKALAYYKEYADWKDSVWDLENQKALQQARAKYESREKKKEIELLEKHDQLMQARIEKQNIIIYACIAIVIVLIALSGLLAHNHKKRKKAYEKLEQHEQRLKEKQKAIEQQNEELKQMNEEKNNFIRILAHDLRNPLSQMQGMADLILMDAENLQVEHKENLEYIKEASNHANNMIAKLLDINALENKTIQPQSEQTDLGTILEKVVSQYQNKAKEKSISIQWEIPSGFAQLYTDPYYCRQVFDNLINNALKYSPKGSKVYLKAYEEADALVTVVQDEGPGISQEEQQKLFQKFQKLSSKPTGNEPSTGLGLSIVKKYVEALNGEVWCESKEGEGTRFLVKLPKAGNGLNKGLKEKDEQQEVT